MCSAFAKRVGGCGISVATVSLLTICRARQHVIPVWPGAAPGSESWTQKEETTTLPPVAAGGPLIRNVTQPTLTVFPPDPSKANGTAVIVCLGGGFHFLSWESEGTKVAEWLSAHGVAAFVLKYRLVDTGSTAEDFRNAVMALFNPAASAGRPAGGNGLPESMQKVMPLAFADGRQAMKLVRGRASEWGIAPDRIGIMGFSAGGMVTMGVVMERGSLGGRCESARGHSALYPLRGQRSDRCDGQRGHLYPVEDRRLSRRAPHVLQGRARFWHEQARLPTDHWIERFGEWLEAQGFMKPEHEGHKT